MSYNLYFQYDTSSNLVSWSDAAQSPPVLSEVNLTISDTDYDKLRQNYKATVDMPGSRLILTKPLGLTVQQDKATLQAQVDAADISLTTVANLLLKIIP